MVLVGVLFLGLLALLIGYGHWKEKKEDEEWEK